MRPNDELLLKIGHVRRKWKTFLWVRGLAWVLGVLVVSLALGLALADSKSVPYWAVTTLRFGFVIALVFTVIRALVIPLRRTPSDIQLAQFVEEKNPGLEERLVSAVEAIHKPRPEHGMFGFLLIKDALERTKRVRFGEQINKRKFSAFSALSAALAIAFLIGLYVASFFFPYGAVRLFTNPLKPPAMDVLEIKVTPGNVTVPRGSDVPVQAVLSGLDVERAEVHLRYDNSSEWEASAMEVVPQSLPTYRHVLYNLQEAVHYYVEARGRRSDEFTIRVADLPRVEKLEYTYHYPAYTGMAPKKEDNALDMVAPKGTTSVHSLSWGWMP